MENPVPDFQQFALDIQSAMQSAIAEAEKLRDEAAADREQAAEIRSQAIDLRHKIENREHRKAEDFFAQNAKRLKDEMREKLLEQVAQKLRKAGMAEDRISLKLATFSE